MGVVKVPQAFWRMGESPWGAFRLSNGRGEWSSNEVLWNFHQIKRLSNTSFIVPLALLEKHMNSAPSARLSLHL